MSTSARSWDSAVGAVAVVGSFFPVFLAVLFLAGNAVFLVGFGLSLMTVLGLCIVRELVRVRRAIDRASGVALGSELRPRG